jgi:hypothetical protein
MGILNRLKTEGKIVRWLQFENGLLNDIITKEAPTLRAGILDKLGIKGHVRYSAVNLSATDCTVVCKVDWKEERRTVGGVQQAEIVNFTGFTFYNYDVNRLSVYDGAVLKEVITPVANVAKTFGFSIVASTKIPSFYKNGVNLGSTTALTNLPNGVLNISPTTVLDNTIKQVLIFNVKLTDSEMAEVHTELENMKFNKNVHTNTVSRDYTINKGLVFKHSALKNGKIYNLVNNDAGTIVGNFTSVNTKMNCVIRGSATFGKYISFPNNASYSFTDNIFSISFWCKPLDGQNKALIDKSGTGYEYIFGTSDTPNAYWFNCYTSDGSATVYDSGYISFTTGKTDMWTITADGSFMYIYRNNTLLKTVTKAVGKTMTAGNGVLKILGGFALSGSNSHADFKMNGMWNRCLSQDEVYDMYNKTNPLYKTEFGAVESSIITGGNLSNTKYEVISGGFQIGTHTIDGKTVKCITCTSTGIINLPTNLFLETPDNAAYGKWEWYFYAGSGITERQMNFVHTSKTGGVGGYSLYYDGTYDKCFSLTNTATTFLNVGVEGSYPLNSLYKITVLRQQSGNAQIFPISSIFTVYINDILMPVSSGTNPVVSSTYRTSTNMPFGLSTGDKIMLSDSHGDYAFVKK